MECDVPYGKTFALDEIFGMEISNYTVEKPDFLDVNDELVLMDEAGDMDYALIDVYVSGKYVYTCGLQGEGWTASGVHSYGFNIFEIDLATHKIVGNVAQYDLPYHSYGLFVSGDYAYVANGAAGLQIIDVSDASSPTIVGAYSPATYAMGVFVLGNIAYVADGWSGLKIINVTNSESPTLQGLCEFPGGDGYAWSVDVSGQYAYVAEGYSGLRIVDVSNTSSPTLKGSCETPDEAFDVAVSGNYAYVADELEGLFIINISNPSLPIIEGSHDFLYGFTRGVDVSGNFAYLANGLATLVVLEVSDKTSPTFRSQAPYNPEDLIHSEGVFFSDDYVYIVGGALTALSIFASQKVSSVHLSGSTCDLGGPYKVKFTACNENLGCGEESFDLFVGCNSPEYLLPVLVINEFNQSCTDDCSVVGPYFNDTSTDFRHCSSCDRNCYSCTNESIASCTGCEGNWDFATQCTSCLNNFYGGDCGLCSDFYSSNGFCNELSGTAVLVIIVLSVVTLIIMIICFAVVFCVVFSLVMCKKVQQFSQLDDFELLLAEQIMAESKKPLPKHQINKSLFDVDPNTIVLKRKLGKGAGGTVYRAEWNKQIVAYKVFCVEENKFAEFEKELEIISSLGFPFIVSFYGATLSESKLGILMEFCSEGEVTCFIGKQKGSYPLKGKLRLLSEVASAMIFLHSKKIIHRDLKSDNVLVTDQERAKVMDFGLSKFNVNDDVTKTRRVGTSFYMAPEVLSGHYSYSCDVFSFSILCYCVLTENFLPYGMNCGGIEARVAMDREFRPSFVGFGVLDGMKKLMKQNWSHDAEKRMNFREILVLIKQFSNQAQDTSNDDRSNNTSNNASNNIVIEKFDISEGHNKERIKELENKSEELRKIIEEEEFTFGTFEGPSDYSKKNPSNHSDFDDKTQKLNESEKVSRNNLEVSITKLEDSERDSRNELEDSSNKLEDSENDSGNKLEDSSNKLEDSEKDSKKEVGGSENDSSNKLEDLEKKVIFTAIYRFESRERDELSFETDDEIVFCEKTDEDGWHLGRIGNRTGLYPTTHVVLKKK